MRRRALSLHHRHGAAYWARFCEAVGRPDFIPLQNRVESHPEIHEALESDLPNPYARRLVRLARRRRHRRPCRSCRSPKRSTIPTTAPAE
jgi:hypothetical protein